MIPRPLNKDALFVDCQAIYYITNFLIEKKTILLLRPEYILNNININVTRN